MGGIGDPFVQKLLMASAVRRRDDAKHGAMDTAVTLAGMSGWDAATTVDAAEQFYAYLIKDRTNDQA